MITKQSVLKYCLSIYQHCFPMHTTMSCSSSQTRALNPQNLVMKIQNIAGLLKPLVILYCATGGADFYEYTERTMVRQHTSERIPAGAERGTAKLIKLLFRHGDTLDTMLTEEQKAVLDKYRDCRNFLALTSVRCSSEDSVSA